ncbi:MAG: hypothetical protein ACI8QC_004244 [Planctomycetota bacterium]|jgi:hypothetical protein
MDAVIEEAVAALEPDSTVYVADENLRVVHTNDHWQRFAHDNKGAELAGPEWNTHLLDNMSGKERERWASIYSLLLSGELSHYEEDFICSSPEEHRIYRLRSTPVKGEDGATLLIHHTVRIDDKAGEREAMRVRLRTLDTDPKQVENEYRSRVLDSQVAVPGFRVAQFVRPLDDVGGDIVWHRRYAGGTTDLILADAMGHGVEASLHAAKMVMMLDSLAAPYRQPQDILASLNRGMLRHRPEHETAFATGILFRFQHGSSVIRCTNFGHNSPIFSRSGEVSMGAGLALGITDSIPIWPEIELDLQEHGTRFLVFSDGITEQFDSQGQMYGSKGLIGALKGSLDIDLESMLDQIVDDWTAFRGNAVIKDDQVLLALQFME